MPDFFLRGQTELLQHLRYRGCDELALKEARMAQNGNASSTSSGDYARPRNIADAFARYRGQFGPVGVVFEGGFIVSGKDNVNQKDRTGFREFMDLVFNYSLRRHEIAHGRVCNLGEYSFYLAPNNTLSRNFPNGNAIYKYTSTDIKYFCGEFDNLAKAAEPFGKRLAHR